MRSNFMKMDRWLLFWTIFMFILGLFMIFSASSVEASLSGAPYYYFIRQAIILIICCAITFIIITIPWGIYRKMAFLFAIAIIVSLVVVYLYGAIINQARSWIPLGFYNFQPSEFAKTAIILYMAVYYRKHKDSKNLTAILMPLLVAIAMAALTFIQPDFGTTFIIILLTSSIFFAVPFDQNIKKIIIQFVGLAIIVGALFILVTDSTILRPGQMARLDYKEPCAKYLNGGTGYQVCNGFIAINNGGLWGVGIGNSTQKYQYLPAAHTDFIFAIILEEIGLVASLGIILVYIIIISRIMRIAYRANDLMGSIIAYGTAIYIFLHIAINLVGILGILPLTGVPLPFLSYGGSYALNLSILLALVQKVEIKNKQYIQNEMLEKGKAS